MRAPEAAPSLTAMGTTIRPQQRRGPTTIVPDAYLTDGRRLYRVVRGFSWPPQYSVAELEDCHSLERRAYTPAEILLMDLTPVARRG